MLTNNSNIKLYMQLQDLHNFKKDKSLLKKIISEHVKPADSNKKIELITYYKPLKIASILSGKGKKQDLDRSSVVYKFQCLEDGCQASYIGRTTCLLSKRTKQHRYKSSSIYKHFESDHSSTPPPYSVLSQTFSVVKAFHSRLDLKIAEALYIKEQNPYINIKFNECSNFLNLFK